MQFKEGLGWKACYNEEKGLYGAEVMFQGSWELYEIDPNTFAALNKHISGSEAERLISAGRRLYMHVNDRCGPPYTVVLDDDYALYCPWMAENKPAAKETWSEELTDAAVELFESEKANREQRRRKRAKRNKKSEHDPAEGK